MKRSSLACSNCKRTKRKCDISQQSLDSEGCTNCSSKGEVCEIRYGEDKRRKRHTPADSDVLTRLSALESLLANNNATDQTLKTPDILKELAKDSAERNEPDESLRAEQLEPCFESNQPANFEGVEQQDNELSVTPPPAPTSVVRGSNMLLGGPSPEFSEGCSVGDSGSILEKVISREGGLDGKRGNQLTYFGSTGIYHLSREPQRHRALPDYSALEPEFDTSNEPQPLVNYLLDLFWTWQASHLQILHRRLFTKDKESFDTEQPRGRYAFFSPALLYAVMALAAMLSDDRGVQYQSTKSGGVPGDIYFEKAKALFDREMGCPAVTTVQTALLIGSRYGAVGQNSLGWTYSGIAMRMVTELGLNFSNIRAVQAEQMSEDMAEVRRTAFWGCYVQDKLWSAYCGRPSALMDETITIELPESHGQDHLHDHSHDEAVQQNIVLITVECSKILSELYSQKYANQPEALQSSAVNIHTNLLTWHNCLPDDLSWPNRGGSPSSPGVLLLHMQFYFTLLLLYRPFIEPHSLPAGNMQSGRLANANDICTLAATNITKLIRDYGTFFDLKKIVSPAIHFIFVASSIHLINHQLSRQENTQVLFQGCLSSLLEISKSYPSGRNAYLVLNDLWHQFQSSGPRLQSQNSAMRFTNDPRSDETQYALQRSASRKHLSSRRSTGDLNGRADHCMEKSATDTRACVTLGSSAQIGPECTQRLGHSGNTGNTASHIDQSPIDLTRFDWSMYNSPLDLPPSLNEVDASAFDLSKMRDVYGVFGIHLPSAAPTMDNNATVGDGLNADVNTLDTPFDGLHSSHALLDRIYGTTFGLDEYLQC